MAKNICLSCNNKKKFMAYNYAGFKIKEFNLHAFPERLLEDCLPGNKESDFLCVECANKTTVTCSVHGPIDDYFSLGVPPQCSECKAEKKESDKEAEIEKLWAEYYPEALQDTSLKLYYIRGALAAALTISDGVKDESELKTVEKVSSGVTGRNRYGMGAFCSGFNERIGGNISNSEVLDLCLQQENKKSNVATLKMLLSISAADGLLDKGEYNFIQKVARQFQIDIPSFEQLANSLALDTANLKRDRALKTTGEVGAVIGTGALVVGGIAVSVLAGLADSNTGNRAKASSNRKSANGRRQVNGTGRSCLTCAHWRGRRESSGGYYISYYPSDIGECSVGYYKGKERAPLQRCTNKWIRWGQLHKVR